ncbi:MULTISPECIES: hypothetical protein [Flavobacterium]|uniref:Lipoprotein n=1 Tax=Flavobacterium hankyongi TaxID=1176532 RepID=A0ABP8ZZX7_9FLAO|nr:hypothetical protein [Flavobacterium sp. N1846]
MVSIKYTFIAIVFIFIGCKKNIQNDKDNPKEVKHSEVTKGIDIHDCTTVKDTIFKDNDYVKYISLKEKQYGIEIKLNNVIDTLNFSFDCSSPNGMIPKILFKHEDYIVLSQGTGFNYRSSILCNLDNKGNRIDINEYEIEIVEPSENDFCAFLKNNIIYLYNRNNKILLAKDLPSNFLKFQTKKCQLNKGKVNVYFENKETLTYNLKEFVLVKEN